MTLFNDIPSNFFRISKRILVISEGINSKLDERYNLIISTLAEKNFSSAYVTLSTFSECENSPKLKCNTYSINSGIENIGEKIINSTIGNTSGSFEEYIQLTEQLLENFILIIKPTVIISLVKSSVAKEIFNLSKKFQIPHYYEINSLVYLKDKQLAKNQLSNISEEKLPYLLSYLSDKVIVKNKFHYDESIYLGEKEEKLIYLPNSILEQQAPKNKKPLIDSSFTIGVTLQEDIDKIENLYKILSSIFNSGLKFNILALLCKSSDADRTTTNNFIKERLEKIKNTFGVATTEETCEFYNSIDIYANLDIEYDIGNFDNYEYLDAITNKIPLLLSNIKPNIALHNQNSNFTLFDISDEKDLAEKIVYLMSNRDTMKKLAEESFTWLKNNRSYDKIASGILHAINSDSINTITFSENRIGKNQSRITESSLEKKIKPKNIFTIDKEHLLNNNPIRVNFIVKPGNKITIHAGTIFRNIKENKNRKAVILIEFYDIDGNHVSKGYGKLAYSKAFNSHYKYLTCTNGVYTEIYNLKVPDSASKVEISFETFNAKPADIIKLVNLKIEESSIPVQKIDQFAYPSNQAAAMSITGWPKYPDDERQSVIGVMDEFTTGCFEEDLILMQPRPDNWYGLAVKYKPTLFFIESAWKGNFGSWQYRVAAYNNKPGQEVAHMCDYAKSNNIPSIFWNKEDPVHHDKFMNSAKLTDYIFTTDANMISSYIEKTGNTKVYALPFAAQPALHKPAPLNGRKNLSCFAGSWYGDRHAERGQVMGWLLDAANKHGLEIYDRNFGTEIFPFPSEYQKGIKGSLPYKDLCREYSKYRIFLNVNSVTDSPTMFSRRVFELMACGTPIVSTYAKGIEELFESDAVWMVRTPEEAEKAISTLMYDDVEWRRRSLAGIREIFSNHTYAHRINYIFEKTGINSKISTTPLVYIIANVESDDQIQFYNDFIHSQKYKNTKLVYTSKNKELLENIVSNDNTIVTTCEDFQNLITIIATKTAIPSLIGIISSKFFYGEHYVTDLVNASIYEPEAFGWGKSIDTDHFDYDHKTIYEAVLWKTTHFSVSDMNRFAACEISDRNLYIADSNEFKKQHDNV